MDLKSKKILIAGAGISGIGAAALLGKAGIPAAIYDAVSYTHLIICYSDIYRVVCSDICLHDTSDALRSIYSGLSECNEYCSSYGILFDGHFL